MKSLSKLTLLAALLCGGANAAWAEGEVAFTAGNTIGDATNPAIGGWYYAKSEIIEIPANKTLTLKFKTFSATDEQITAASAPAWGAYMTHVINLWGGVANLFWRGDGYGWHSTDPEENTSGSGWFSFLGQNTRWGDGGADLRADITGSDVVMTIARVGGELRMTQDFSAASGKYRRYFVVNYGTANASIWAQLAVERAYVTVSEDYSITDTTTPVITGTQIGLANNTTPFWSQWSDYFTIAPEKSLTLRYKCYTNRINNWNGAVPYVTTDADRGADGYTEYFGLRPDNWINIANANATTTNYDVIGWNWDTFREKVDGSTVTLNITRTGANVTIREEFAPLDGSTTLFEEYTQACGDGTQNIRMFLTVEGAHIDLLPVTKNITAAGWATLCSEYALDFTGSIANLEKAYAITGNSGTTLTLTEINQVVAAGEGILLKGSGNCNIPIKGSGTAVTGNLLKGVTANTDKDANSIYVLMDGEKGVGFYKNNNAFTVGANTAYLNAADMVGAPSFVGFFDGEVTGIDASLVKSEKRIVNATPHSDQWSENSFYDLQGRRVATPTKGLYLMNGKKVVIK